ncbi:hypothetical protein ANO11243_008460 [Dothideomycetidae sp. 11243]|nr:hypothetical protein ANO11243_008460 [fungal sp. No.11243]
MCDFVVIQRGRRKRVDVGSDSGRLRLMAYSVRCKLSDARQRLRRKGRRWCCREMVGVVWRKNGDVGVREVRWPERIQRSCSRDDARLPEIRSGQVRLAPSSKQQAASSSCDCDRVSGVKIPVASRPLPLPPPPPPSPFSRRRTPVRALYSLDCKHATAEAALRTPPIPSAL